MRLANAFTLIELLVVVTIIVVLLALLAPALDKAIDQAERVVCEANLHAWGIGLGQHALEHKNKVLAAPGHALGATTNTNGQSWLYPNHPMFRTPTGPEAGQFALDPIAPYVQGGDSGQPVQHVGKIWYCPASLDHFFYSGGQDQANQGNLKVGDVQVNFMFNDYAYFGRCSTLYRDYATTPDALTGDRLEPGKIVMADTIYRWNSGNGQWWFNHSTVGYSVHDRFGGGDMVFSGEPPLTGTSQLFGDGSVAWKDGSRFDPRSMNARAPTADGASQFVSESPGPGTGGSMNFY